MIEGLSWDLERRGCCVPGSILVGAKTSALPPKLAKPLLDEEKPSFALSWQRIYLYPSEFSRFAWISMVMTRSRPSTPRAMHRNLPMLLLRARELMMARFRPLLTAQGLTEQQWRIIRALHENGPLEPRQICALCTISSPSLAGVLARMEDLGHVTKERFEDDQRRVRVSLTAQSEAAVERMKPLLEAEYRELEKQVGTEAVENLYVAVDALIAKLDADGESEA
jgi:homoprotocatechuate degradation regulator HpaR